MRPASEIAAVKITPAAFAGLLRLVSAGQINLNSAKRVFGVMFETGRGAPEIVQELGLAQVSDTDALAAAVAKVLAQNGDEVAKYRGGKESLFNWFLGQVMRETRGKGNPAVVKELLAAALKGVVGRRGSVRRPATAGASPLGPVSDRARRGPVTAPSRASIRYSAAKNASSSPASSRSCSANNARWCVATVKPGTSHGVALR